MDHRAAREVDGAAGTHIEQESVAGPHPVTQGVVDDQAPQSDEEAIASKANPFGEGAGHDRGGDDGELALEHRKYVLGHALVHDAHVDAFQEYEVGIPAEPTAHDVGAEGHGVAAHGPQHTDHRHGGEGMQHGAQHVLGSDEAAVEHGEARDHQEDQRGRGQHPRGDTRINLRNLRSRGKQHAPLYPI